MKAFPDNGSLTWEQKTYNYRLSKARVVVEHAYGRRNDVLIDLPKLVATCVLHNIL